MLKLRYLLLVAAMGSGAWLHAQQSGTNYSKLAPDQGDDAPQVSIVQLIANPAQFDHKKVRIIGYLHLEFEGDAIYLHKEDMSTHIYENSVWINTPRDMTAEQRAALNNHYVLCTATFTSQRRGHMGMFAGELSDIVRLEVWVLN
jgi:hypothetical protein